MLYSIAKLCWDNSWSIIKFIVFAAALIGSFMAIFTILFRRHVSENWDYYRNDPNILKYSGLFHKDDPNDDWITATQKNYNRVLTEKSRKFVRMFMQPWIGLAEGMVEASNANLLSMENMRGGFSYMRAMLSRIMVNILNRIANVQAAVMMILFRVREGLKKQIGIFSLLSWTIQNNYFFLWSMMNGPIGRLGDLAEGMQWFFVFTTFGVYGPPIYNSLCFAPDTPVRTKTATCPIRDIRVGDRLADDSAVLAKISIAAGRKSVYRINGIEVSGDHLMWCSDSERWMRVCDNELATAIEYDGELFCLITESGVIDIDGKSRHILFRDYIDTHNPETWHHIRKFAVEWLNRAPCKDYCDTNEMVWGLVADTRIVCAEDGSVRRLADIRPGDSIWCRGASRRVLARFDMADKAQIMKWKGIRLTGNCCLEVDGRWVRAAMIGNPILDTQTLIHLIVEGGAMEVAGDEQILVRDFIDVNTPAYNKFIDEYVERQVNIV